MASLYKPIVLILILCFTSCKDDKRGLVVGKIHKASKLATTEFTVSKIVHGTKTKKIGWFVKLNETRFIAYSKALITTGVDLQKLGRDDIKMIDNGIELYLPPVEVLNFSYPPDEFVLDTQISDVKKIFNEITVFDQEEFFRQAEIDIRNNLEYMGIVETTQQKTRHMLEALLRSMDYEEIYIHFKSNELIIDKVPETEPS